MTPPYRGRQRTSISTDYGERAQDVAAPYDIDFWFLLDRDDAEKAGFAVGQLIFSSPTQSEEQSLAQLRALPKGAGVFRILDADSIPGSLERGAPLPPEAEEHGHPDAQTLERLYGVITRIRFAVELTVPARHRIPEGLRSRPAPCPGPWVL